MKLLILSAVLFGFVMPARANLVPLSGGAEVSASGAVAIYPNHGGATDSYAFSQTALAPFETFQGDVAGVATATAQPIPGWVYYLPLEYRVESRSIQTTTVAWNGISIAGSLYAGSGAHAQVGTLSASAVSVFDVTFRLDQTMNYTLGLSSSSFHSHLSPGGLLADPVFSLTAVGGGFGLGTSDVVRTNYGSQSASWAFNGNGVLSPGDYRLIYNLSTGSLFGDPLGESSSSTFNLHLNMVSTPDAGATAGLVLVGLAAVLGLRARGRSRP